MQAIALLFFCSVLPYAFLEVIPGRFDLLIDRLRQYQYYDFAELLDDASTFAINSISSLPSNNQTTQCERDFQLILEAAAKRDLWALKTIDAWGKPLPSGILKGNVYWIGNYDECLQPLYQTTNKSFLAQPFETQYCALVPPSNGSSTPSLVLGMCVPSSCDHASVVALIHTLFKKTHITTKDLACSNDPPNGQKGLTGGAIGTIVVISLLGLLVLVGTVVDVFVMSRVSGGEKMDSPVNSHSHMVDDKAMNVLVLTGKRYEPSQTSLFLAEFSALRTLRRIFTIRQKNSHETYPFLNGIRVLALFWVIIGHSLVFGLSYSSNPLDLVAWTRNVFFQLIINAVLSVDTFFVLSGFLTTVLFVREVEKRGTLSIRLMVLYYVHRYIRLTPAFLLMILVSINLTAYFGHGPLYPSAGGFEAPDCRSQYWWTSIVYVGNIVKPDAMCLPITWYLHNDMQFHWVAPLSLIPFVLGRKAISWVIAVALALTGSISILSIILYYPDMSLNSLADFGPSTGPNFFNLIYITPWCRISPYAIGMIAGYLVLDTGRQYRLHQLTKYIGTFVITVVGLACLFSTYPDYILAAGLNRTILIVYQTLSRPLWALVIAWILLLCKTNQAGIVNTILSWPIWAPFARLNYSCYLVHGTIIYIGLCNQTMPVYYQGHLVVNNFVSHIFFSYTAAVLVSILFETPFFILEKRLFRR